MHKTLMTLKTATHRCLQARSKMQRHLEKIAPIGTKVVFPHNGQFVLGEVVSHVEKADGTIWVGTEKRRGIFNVRIDDLELA